MHVAVIGGGIAGLATAWSLVRRGTAVTLFEQGAIPNPLGASGDHHRIIRRAYGSQGGYQRRITDAYNAWDEMWADLGQRHLVDCGFLLISQFAGDPADVLRQGLADLNDPHDTFDAAEAVRRYPYLDLKGFREATFSPEGGALLCRHIAADLADWLDAHGATLNRGTTVTAIDADHGLVHVEDREPARFDQLVITAGAWVLRLVPGLSVDLTPWRTAVAYADPPPDLQEAWARSPVILDTGGTADGYVLPPVGGTGLKFGSGRHKYTSEPDRNRAVEPDEGRAILSHMTPPFARIEEYVIRDVVSCAYTFTVDEHFLARRIGRATVVSACSGHGYKFGAAVGQNVAEAILSGDHARLAGWIEARD